MLWVLGLEFDDEMHSIAFSTNARRADFAELVGVYVAHKSYHIITDSTEIRLYKKGFVQDFYMYYFIR
jgi:hypothetical protein